jgi:hypothetical protein
MLLNGWWTDFRSLPVPRTEARIWSFHIEHMAL